jgi:hypothetical protein
LTLRRELAQPRPEPARWEDRTMNRAGPLPSPALALPALVASADDATRLRFLEFFAVTIRNPHTRRAYMRAAGDFLAWCEARGVASLAGVQPLHVAAWVEALGASWPRPASSSSSPACATCSTGW